MLVGGKTLVNISGSDMGNLIKDLREQTSNVTLIISITATALVIACPIALSRILAPSHVCPEQKSRDYI